MEKQPYELNILYEDNHIIVVEKPQNVPTQEDESKDPDLLNMVKAYIKEKYNKPGNVFVGLVHRLDRPTGGVMVFAKTSKAAARLSEQITSGVFEKKYFTVVLGKPRETSNRLVHFLKKNEKENIVSIVPQSEEGAKRCELVYKTLETKDEISLCEVKILTGRSHQIRVQMSAIGNPVFGDAKYGGDKLGKGFNLALWAVQLKFEHPTTKQIMTFVSYPTEDMIPWKFFTISKYLMIKST
ncbi:MAG: RluA family pseudouridine synthase [Clostridia bacterium]